LRTHLFDAFRNPTDWEQLVVLVPGVVSLYQISGGGATPEIIDDVIGHLSQTNQLVDLLRAANETRQGLHPGVAGLLAEFDAEPGVAAESTNHFAAVLFSGWQVMLDRKPLRDTVKLLGEEPGSRVFVISGPSCSGKSHSAQFFSHLAWNARTFQVVKVDVDALKQPADPERAVNDPTVDPMALGRAIVEKIRQVQEGRKRAGDLPAGFEPIDVAGMPSRDQEQESRWAERFCEWLAGQIGMGDRPWWIVLDGLNKALVGTSTHEMIAGLARLALDAQPMWRLVLIGYDDARRLELDNRLGASVDSEQIDLDWLRSKRDEVVAEGITTIYVERERRQGRVPDPAALQPSIADTIRCVLADKPASDETWLRTLGIALSREARNVFAAGGAAPANNGGGGT
jgi:hypothetical protein